MGRARDGARGVSEFRRAQVSSLRLVCAVGALGRALSRKRGETLCARPSLARSFPRGSPSTCQNMCTAHKDEDTLTPDVNAPLPPEGRLTEGSFELLPHAPTPAAPACGACGGAPRRSAPPLLQLPDTESAFPSKLF